VILLACLAVVGCGPPPFVVHVTWAEKIELVRGSAVIYEGVKIGQVENVSLRQDDPQRAALIAVSLEITDRDVKLRSADRFHLASLRGVPIVEIEPSRESSSLLAPGATVAGVPPFVTRVEQQLGAAVESIGDLAIEAVEEALEALDKEVRDEAADHPDPGPQLDPTSPR
jgi:ABC-type transporter Mla subunit MlaD